MSLYPFFGFFRTDARLIWTIFLFVSGSLKNNRDVEKTSRKRERRRAFVAHASGSFFPRGRGFRSARAVRASRAAGQFCLDGDSEVGLMHPTAGVRSAVPALQRNRTNTITLFVVKDFEEGL